MNTITIPATREEMVTTLTGWQTLITATQWSKAATLAAFVDIQVQDANRFSIATKSGRYTPGEFAKLGIAGLRSKDTIRKYVRRWIATTRPIPKPGDKVNLDGLPEWDVETVEVQQPEPPAPSAPRQRSHRDLTPEEQAADDAIAAEGAKNLVRKVKAEEAVEDDVNRSEAKGEEFQAKAMRYIKYLVEYGHRDRFIEVHMYVERLYDPVEDMTPEMFHD